MHRLGNLALLTQPLSSEASNGSFCIKRPEITRQSLLVLNSFFQKLPNDDAWNENSIGERGERIADLTLRSMGISWNLKRYARR